VRTRQRVLANPIAWHSGIYASKYMSPDMLKQKKLSNGSGGRTAVFFDVTIVGGTLDGWLNALSWLL
jgi:hypothetical protein